MTQEQAVAIEVIAGIAIAVAVGVPVLLKWGEQIEPVLDYVLGWYVRIWERVL